MAARILILGSRIAGHRRRRPGASEAGAHLPPVGDGPGDREWAGRRHFPRRSRIDLDRTADQPGANARARDALRATPHP